MKIATRTAQTVRGVGVRLGCQDKAPIETALRPVRETRKVVPGTEVPGEDAAGAEKNGQVPVFRCGLIQFACRRATRRRCLVDHWKFGIEAPTSVPTTSPYPQLCTSISRRPIS